MSSLILVDNHLRLSDSDNEPPCSLSTEPFTVKSVSVTQTSDFRRCPRRWFFKKVRHVAVPEKVGKGKHLGNEIHHEIEMYFKHKQRNLSSPHSKKVTAAIMNLPTECGSERLLGIERNFSLLTEGYPKYTGKKDLELRWKDGIGIIDHKTTSRFNALLASPVALARDAQSLVYAHEAYVTYQPEHVYATHNTISTTHVARVAPLAWTKITKLQAEEEWGLQLQTIRRMIETAQAPPSDWNDVQVNPEACGDYGGCEFLAICTVKTPSLGWQRSEMAHDENMASDLMARLAALTAPKSEAVQMMTLNLGAMPEVANQVLGMFSQRPQIEVDVSMDSTQIAKTVMKQISKSLDQQLARGSGAVDDVALLSPDAPTRETPQPEEDLSEEPKPSKAKRAKKATSDVVQWQHKVDKVLETTDGLEAYLDSVGSEGWELVGFFDGISAVFKRVKATG